MRKSSHFSVLLVALVVVILMMWLLNGSNFMSIGNFRSMSYQLPELGILTLAMMIAMLTAGINLSIIASANLSGIVMAMIITRLTSPESPLAGSIWVVLLALLAGLLVGILIGAVNGFLVAVVDISPILATLGTSILINGFAVVMTRGSVISGFPKAMLAIGNKAILGIPNPMLIFLMCAALMTIILNHTPLGTSIYMLGSNPIACFYSGVNNRRVLSRTYIISGIYASIAAMIMISRFNSAKADYGESYLLQTVLAAVLGGVSAAGGFGKVSGVVLSLMIMQIISSGLNQLGVSNFLTLSLWGIILILVMVVKFLIENYDPQRRSA